MAAKPLTKSQIAAEIAEKAQIPKRTAVEILFDEDVWQLRLLDILKELKAGVPVEMGV